MGILDVGWQSHEELSLPGLKEGLRYGYAILQEQGSLDCSTHTHRERRDIIIHLLQPGWM